MADAADASGKKGSNAVAVWAGRTLPVGLSVAATKERRIAVVNGAAMKAPVIRWEITLKLEPKASESATA